MLYGAGEGQPLAAARATACIGLSMYIRRERHIGEGAAAASQRHKALQLLQMTIITNDNYRNRGKKALYYKQYYI